MPESPVEGEPAANSRHRWRLLLVALALIVAGAVVGGGVVAAIRGDSDGEARAVDVIHLANLQSACRSWRAGPNPAGNDGGGPEADWCDAMTGWIYQHLVTGQMTAMAMLGSPDATRESCGRWAAARADAAGTAAGDTRLCDEMVSWMQQHMGEWQTWMFGPVMGR